ncbi:MAG: hypothetical protein NTY81_01095 [Candidatus Staskawiczbacteria bacterium]|nr:hypothetical protein [Candidatus Staskawiczbacteria bacterium]
MKKYNIKCKINEQMEVESDDKEQALSNFIEWIKDKLVYATKIEEVIE